MYVMSNRQIVKEKLGRIINGYSAYAESVEEIRMMKREITKNQIPVICDNADSGCWFIPE